MDPTFGEEPGAAVPTLATWMSLTGAVVFVAGFGFVVESNLLALNVAHVRLELWLLALVGAATLAWHAGARAGWWSHASGAGLALAGFAVVAGTVTEVYASFFPWPIRETLAGPRVAQVRATSLVACVFGLSCVLAQCLFDRVRSQDRFRTSSPRPRGSSGGKG